MTSRSVIAGRRRAAAARDPIPRDVRLLALVIVLGAIGAILATTSVSVAFDALGRELGAGLGTVQWIATGYLLGLATVIATTGWLARRFGARRVYLTSIALFLVMSLLCALATSIEALIVFRILQGVAGGATLPVGQMMLASAAGPERMGRVMGIAGIPMLLAPIVGPTVGGLLLEWLSWHWIFLMNVPLSLSALVLGRFLLPAMPTRDAGPFDLPGFVYLTLGAPAIVYGLARGVATGSFGGGALVPIAAGAVLIAVFAVHAWRAAHPLLDVRLWSNRGFAACALTAALVSATLFGMLVLLPVYFQLALGESAFMSGLLLAPQGLGTAGAMLVAGRLTDRVGGGLVALGGIALLVLTTVPFAFAGPDLPHWLLLLLLLGRGIGAGASIMPAYAAVFALLERRQLPDSTPQMNLVQRLGQAVGTAILAVVLAGQLEGASGPAAVSDAFNHTFALASVFAALALVPAAALAVIDSRRTAGRGPVEAPDPTVA